MEQWVASLFTFFPTTERLIPSFNTSNSWVVTNNANFSTQLISCGYSISGAYSRTPRWIYYSLTILAVIIRHHDWIAGAFMTSVMMYSSVASVHALALVCIRYQLLAGGYEFVTVDTFTNLELPVWPSAADNDCDAVLGVVGASFLILMPMQTNSSIFKHASAEIKTLLFMWGLLLLIGMTAALVNDEYIGVWSFPQFRFCPLGYNDTLPFASTAPSLLLSSWNETIWGTIGNSSAAAYGASCLYPCFSTQWAFRDKSELLAISRDKTQPINTMAAWTVNILVYTLITTSSLSSLTVFFTQLLGYKPLRISSRRNSKQVLARKGHLPWPRIRKLVWIPSELIRKLSKKVVMTLETRPVFNWSTVIAIGCILGSLFLKIIDVYARIISPITFVLFIVWIEWCITTDLEGETFRHIGQWGSLVAAGLALLGAMIARYNNKLSQWIKDIKRTLHFETSCLREGMSGRSTALNLGEFAEQREKSIITIMRRKTA